MNKGVAQEVAQVGESQAADLALHPIIPQLYHKFFHRCLSTEAYFFVKFYDFFCLRYLSYYDIIKAN